MKEGMNGTHALSNTDILLESALLGVVVSR